MRKHSYMVEIECNKIVLNKETKASRTGNRNRNNLEIERRTDYPIYFSTTGTVV